MSVLLAAPINCPPSVGQIKWDDFSFSFKARGKRMTVSGPLWDRDRNGRPSKGDLFRVDSTSHGAADETWVVLGRGLAGTMNKTFRRNKGRLTASCEARFQIKGVPRLGSAAKLGAMLLRQGGGERLSPLDALDANMRDWAAGWCDKKRHIEEEQLAKMLVGQAKKSLRGYKGSTLRRHAAKIADEYAMQCAHLTVPKITFD
jgi:hypothetical protein